MLGQEARVAWLRAHAGASAAERIDRSPWDWYAESCSCGLPPGECRESPIPTAVITQNVRSRSASAKASWTCPRGRSQAPMPMARSRKFPVGIRIKTNAAIFGNQELASRNSSKALEQPQGDRSGLLERRIRSGRFQRGGDPACRVELGRLDD